MYNFSMKKALSLLLLMVLVCMASFALADAASQADLDAATQSIANGNNVYATTDHVISAYDTTAGELTYIQMDTLVSVKAINGTTVIIEADSTEFECDAGSLTFLMVQSDSQTDTQAETDQTVTAETDSNTVLTISAASSQAAETDTSATPITTDTQTAETNTTASIDTSAKDGSVDFALGSTQTMQGIYSGISQYVEIPSYATVSSAQLYVSYTSSDLILQDESTLTFYLNNIAFYSCNIVPSHAQETVVVIDVPAEWFYEGFNYLYISGYVRLTDDEGCSDDYNGANWVNILGTTSLHVEYDITTEGELLSYYPYPFLSLADDTGDNFTVAVSDMTDESEMTAAAFLMTDMGAELSGVNDITLATISTTTDDHIVYFGLEKNTSAELLSLLGESVPCSGALIKRVSSGDKEYLLVIANEADALLEAARLLSDDDRVAQLRTSSYHVSVGESDTFLAEELSNSGNYLLKDILEQGITLTGPFHQETSITLPVSSDYTLSSQGKMVFELRYSENLDFDRSLVTVYWGSDRIPLASSKLSADQASGHTLSFTIPADAVGSEGNVIVIAFELEVKDLDCTPRQIDMPWAYISENSAVYLPESDQASLSLGNWPAPFQRNGRLNNVVVVIPDAPTASDLVLLGRTMTAVGTNSDAYGTLQVIKASDFQTSDAQANLIVIGMGTKNTLFSNINSQLLFQYDTLQSQFLSNDKVIFSNSYASEVGSIQLLVSPFDEDYSLLAITAPQQSGLDALTAVMSNPTLQWGLDREAVLVDSTLEMSSYQFTYSSIATNERPSIIDTVVENQESLIFALIGLGTMLLLLIGALIVLLNARRRNKKMD